MIFVVGQLYSNKIGTYKVLSLHNDAMTVSYTDGHQQTLSLKVQTKICENRILTQSITQHPKSKQTNYTYSDYWTLGFLLNRLVHLQHKVMYDKQDEAKVNYYDATGQELDEVKTGVFKYRKGANQWGNQGVITFHASNNELHLLKFKGTPSPLASSPNTYEVSDINFFYFMLKNGFRTGSKQDKDSIISNIPDLYKTLFNQGYEYITKER
jgi:hypothetical protein